MATRGYDNRVILRRRGDDGGRVEDVGVVADHAHVEIAELQHVLVIDLELEVEQARRDGMGLRRPDKHGTGAVTGAASGMDDDVALYLLAYTIKWCDLKNELIF